MHRYTVHKMLKLKDLAIDCEPYMIMLEQVTISFLYHMLSVLRILMLVLYV